MPEFNLIDEPWIPCIDLQGHNVEYGIRDTLLKAHELCEIFDNSPLVTVVLHRLLLAILYRACKGPLDMAEWKELHGKSRFVAIDCIDNYLTEWYDHFYLFDDKFPFMQIPTLDLNEYKNNTIKNDKSDGLMRLSREAPDKGGRVLFDHRVGTERQKYDLKYIAKMLLSAQSYSGTGVASSGVIGTIKITPTPCKFASCVEGLVLWIKGESLFNTLLLNLVPREIADNDKPAWEDNSIVDTAIASWLKPINFIGTVQRYASLCRFINIIDQKSMFFTNGLKTNIDTDDPMMAYIRPSVKDTYHAVKLQQDRAAWRDAHTLFSLGSPIQKPPICLNHLARIFRDEEFAHMRQPKANIVGLATDQGKALLWRYERMPIPISIIQSTDLTERLGTLLNEAETIGGKLSCGLFWSSTSKRAIRKEPVGRIQAISDLVLTPSLELRSPGILRTIEGRKPDEAHNKAVLDLSETIDPRPAYWARLEKHFYTLLDNLPNDWDHANNDWKPDEQQTATRDWRNHVKKEAKIALSESTSSLGSTARAIQARARVRIDFSDSDLKPPQENAAKSKSKKRGGNKE